MKRGIGCRAGVAAPALVGIVAGLLFLSSPAAAEEKPGKVPPPSEGIISVRPADPVPPSASVPTKNLTPAPPTPAPTALAPLAPAPLAPASLAPPDLTRTEMSRLDGLQRKMQSAEIKGIVSLLAILIGSTSAVGFGVSASYEPEGSNQRKADVAGAVVSGVLGMIGIVIGSLPGTYRLSVPIGLPVFFA